MISFDDFKKVELTVGKILSAEKVPETDKLLKLMVNFGNNTNYEQDTKVRITNAVTPQIPSLLPPPRLPSTTKTATGHSADSAPLLWQEERIEQDIRQIISGIATHFPEPQTLVGKKCLFVTNIEPRMIKGLESNGMILALSTDDGKFSLLEPNADIPEGTRAR